LHSHKGIENLTSELGAALSAARRAGEVLRAGFGAEHTITYKGEVDLVTEIDEEAERVIKEELLGIFPSHGMLAEEGGKLAGEEDASLLTSPLFFVVAILATQRYGPVGVACAAAGTTTLQHVIMVLLAKRKTGVWTQVMFSLAPFRKVLSRW
jgi:uncharacterized membrane protein YtjA (UPF0391 family)